jgi:hypothetical protein
LRLSNNPSTAPMPIQPAFFMPSRIASLWFVLVDRPVSRGSRLHEPGRNVIRAKVYARPHAELQLPFAKLSAPRA